jgi:replicative DNA helicase
MSIEAEENVLGAILLEGSVIDVVAGELQADDFFKESHGTIYRTALDLHLQDSPVDPLTLADALKKKGLLEGIGGESKLAYLSGIMPAVSNVGHHARIVAEEGLRRRLSSAGLTVQALAEEGGDVDELRQRVEDTLTKAMETGGAASVASITDGLTDLIDGMRIAYTTGEPLTGTLTGFKGIDDMLLGLWPGQLLIFAARPGQGKSTLSLNIAENIADRGLPCLFVTLEMSRLELQIRSLARAASADSLRLMTGQLTQEEAQRLQKGIDAVKAREGSLFIEDNGDMTVPKLAATASRMKRQGGLGLIVVDYIQLMTATIKSDSRAEQIGSISRGLKQLARRLDVPVIGVSQMNRAIDSRSTHRPVLSDLRESGTLEQDSDVVVFIHDDANYDADKQPDGEVELIVAKNRRGPGGNVKMLYTRKYSKFHNAP